MNDTYKLIPLSGKKGSGLYAKVSPEDYDRCMKYSWWLEQGYPCTKINGKNTRMQLFITDVKHTDHINHDTLNNTQQNLFAGGQRENNRNINKKNDKSTSKYPGVDWYKRAEKWRAQIAIDGKNKHLGYFVNELDAAYTYYVEARKRHPHMQHESWLRLEFLAKCVVEQSKSSSCTS